MARYDYGLQTLWDVYAALGFDTDGDPHPWAVVAGMGVQGFCDMVLERVREHVEEREQEWRIRHLAGDTGLLDMS